MKGDLARLIATHAGAGRVDWIGVRPVRLQPLMPEETAWLGLDGLRGDHARPGKRAVTLMQAEHLPVISALARMDVTPDLLRRNLLISGINLSALNGTVLQIGDAVLRLTGPCAPCSRMEVALGTGGYSAMRGHGGWCAEVLQPGTVAVGSTVIPAQEL